MNAIIAVLSFIIVLSIIVIVHEFGHFVTAKKFGVYCTEFSIGMGPAIYQRKGKESTFSIRALPIGGYVQMAGEEGVDVENIPAERTIKGIQVWKQVIVMAAGAIMNVILAYAVFVGITMYQGAIALPADPIIAQVEDGSAADKAGFEVGDHILEMKLSNGETFVPETFDEITEQMQYHHGKTTFLVARNDKEITLTMTPTYLKDKQMYYMGLGAVQNIQKINAFEAFYYGGEKLVDSTSAIFTALSNIVKGVGLETLSGPVGIFQVTAQSAQSGLLSLLALLGLLSLNIGIFNLLPLPVLDGGRIVLALCEKIAGRKMSEKFETGLMMASIFVLLGIVAFATWNDILKVFV